MGVLHNDLSAVVETQADETCSEQVYVSGGSFRGHRCPRKAVEGGKCRQHSATAKQARMAKSQAKYALQDAHAAAVKARKLAEAAVLKAVATAAQTDRWTPVAVEATVARAMLEAREAEADARAALTEAGLTPYNWCRW